MDSIASLLKGRPLYSISGNVTVAETARYMAEKNVGAIPVVEGNRLVGLFSERDVIKRVVAVGVDPEKTMTRDVMTTSLVVATTEESIEDCLTKMQKAHCRHLPVVSGENLVGFVSLRDLLQRNLTDRQQDLEYLQSYMFTLPPGAAKK
jgi:CBS domain-containing protein